MHKLILVAVLLLTAASGVVAGKERPWLLKDFKIPEDTISPDGRYGVMLPKEEGAEPSKLVELKTGRVVATLAGAYGGWGHWRGAMQWGDMQAVWSADCSMLCWIFPDKWFPQTYVVLKLHDGKLAWQLELMKPTQTEIIVRTETAAPLNFLAAKLANAEDGSAYPEGFSIDVPAPDDGFAIPLKLKATLTSNPKVDAPEENGVVSTMTITISANGSVSYSHFKAQPGYMSRQDIKKLKSAPRKNYPLVDTDIGKALIFPGVASSDRRYSVGWTVLPTVKGAKDIKPVDWSHWDKTDPDQVLRHYDWQNIWDNGPKKMYEAVDFAIDLSTGRTAQLPSNNPCWQGDRSGPDITVQWLSAPGGRHYGLIANNEGEFAENFWLVTADEKGLHQLDLTVPMRKAVNEILRQRRQMVSNPDDFPVAYKPDTSLRLWRNADLATVAFTAAPPSSDERDWELRGVVTLRLRDGTVLGASSDAKPLNLFVTNEELRKADEKLNAVYQAALKQSSPSDAAMLKAKQRDWIKKRDDDASQAVNITPYDEPAEACARVREKSLLESTNARIDELEIQGARSK